MKLGQMLTEEKVTPLPDNEFLSKSYGRIVGAAVKELEEAFRLAMVEYFPTFKYDPAVPSADPNPSTVLSRTGSFKLYGDEYKTKFSTSGFSIRLDKGSNDSQTVKVFAEKIYSDIKDKLTKLILTLDPSSTSFRADYLKMQQDFIDRDLELDIDHVPDKKTIITVTSDDKKLGPFKVKVK